MATDRHQAPSYPLRMPEDLKGRLVKAAADGGRSLHSELLFRLEESFRLAKDDADLSKARMQLAESRLREALLQGEALFLGSCVEWLLHVAESNEIRHVGDAKKLAADAKLMAEKVASYERELNPDVRLEEFKEAIESSRTLVKHWHPKARPWPGGPPLKSEPGRKSKS